MAAVLVLGAAHLGGCGSSQEKPDNAAWETRKGYKALGHDEEGQIDIGGTRTLSGGGGFDWTGVRHDLGINLAKASPSTCACLAVQVGSPDDEAFVWRGAKPDIQGAKLAVAISSLKVECPGGAANPADRRPSISAVERNGKDVFIEIEESTADRPVATGAIIQPVEPGGHIYV
ncbi:MAG TPA: hypothetical protein VL400_08435, partial [Polyangiaceae bacterium]|nr:hypothetical protein [Polyangiaceae bacterium]